MAPQLLQVNRVSVNTRGARTFARVDPKTQLHTEASTKYTLSPQPGEPIT